MKEKGRIIDFFKGIFLFDGNYVYMVFKDNDEGKTIPYFSANDLGKLLGYKEPRKAVFKHVQHKEKHVVRLQDIVENYAELYDNAQGDSKYLDEIGMYYLVINSKMEKAIEVKEWIVEEVIPKLREYGEYKVGDEFRTELKEINKKLEEKAKELKKKDSEIIKLKHNMKNPKFEKGGAVYIMQPVWTGDDLNLDLNKTMLLKFGKTIDMNERVPTYNTCVPNKIDVIKMIYVKDPDLIEKNVLYKLEDYRIKKGKEYFECTYYQMAQIIADCIKYVEVRDIDIEPDERENYISRLKKQDKFDGNKKMFFRVINDDDNDVCSVDQKGGNYENDIDPNIPDTHYYKKYLKYKAKYINMKINIAEKME